jgi:hypothetical protein
MDNAAMRRALVLVMTLALIAGCGGDKTPMTDAEVDTVTRWSAAYKPVAADMLATSDALAKRQLDAAQGALDRLPPKLDAADAQVDALRTTDLKQGLADYMRITRRTITAFGAFLEHLRTDPGDRRARLRVQQELRDANQELFSADSRIRDRIFDHANEAQEKRLDPVIPLPVES